MPEKTDQPDRAFWHVAAVLWRFRGPATIGIIAAVLAGVCFSLGIGTLMPIMNVLLHKEHSLEEMIHQKIGGGPGAEAGVAATVGNWLASHVPTDQLHAFLVCLGVFLFFVVLGNLARYIHGLLAVTVAQAGAMIWRERLFAHLVQTPMLDAQEAGSSDGVTRLLMDSGRLAIGFRVLLHKSVVEIVIAISALSLAVLINWKLSILALIGAPLIGIITTFFGRKIRSGSTRVLESIGDMISMASASLSNADIVKTHGAEGYEKRRFHRANRQMFQQEMRVRVSQALSTPLNEMLSLLGISAVATIAAWFVLKRATPVEEFMTVIGLLVVGGSKVKPLTNMHNDLREAEAAAGRIMEVMHTRQEPVRLEQRSRLPRLHRHTREVRFEHVSFTYPGGERPAVREVDLRVTHGQRIAIVGGNGSGKTTLLAMLPRLIEPDQGRVLIDGVDVTTVDLRSLREQLGVVSQQSVLFEGTIADNIAYGRRWVPRGQIIEAARAAYADEFIAALSRGYDTVLGEGGVGLSGGQRQRLCIARAILRDPAILILDEATSQIDADSEERIARAIAEFTRGRTTFVIAHRLSTVMDADRIVVMDGGQIIDHGTHDELLEKCEIYRLLSQTQLQRSPQA